MRKRMFHLACFLGCLILVTSGFAQEGHPLTGAWTGDWGPSPTERSHITLVLDWNGEDIGGFILVGVNSIPIESTVLNATNWTVHLEANGENASGDTIEISADGQMDNIGSAHRTIQGTWRQDTTEGEFMITRD